MSKRSGKSQRERLVQKQEEAAVAVKEKDVTKEKKAKKRKPTLADLRKQAEAARARVAKFEVQILEQENPELANLTDRLKRATKEAASFPRFIALREKGLATRIRAVQTQRDTIAELKADQTKADSLVAQIQGEIEAARLDMKAAVEAGVTS